MCPYPATTRRVNGSRAARARVGIAAAVALTVIVGCGGHQAGDAADTVAGTATIPANNTVTSTAASMLPIRYLLAPHPDDEFAIWSMAQDPTRYPVLVVLTQGEKTGACAGGGLQAERGERAPSPQPFAAKLTPTCAAERVDSLLAFLHDMGAVDPRWLSLRDRGEHVATDAPSDTPTALAPSPCPTPPACARDATYHLWVGDTAALLVFDLGDGDVTTADVVWAIATTRHARGAFPTQIEGDIVGMGYHNTIDTNFVGYDHPDQNAIRTVLTHDDLGLPGGQYSRTYPDDPDRTMTVAVDAAVFATATAVTPGPVDPVANPDATRVGALQVDYGWLAFPNGYWYAEKLPVHSFYSQEQDFTKAFAS